MTATKLFLNGDFKSSSDGKTIPQTNPATEQIFCEVSAASVADVQAAVEGAQQTFEREWRDLSPRKRTDILFNIARVIRENLETLAQLECQNVGKPISDARDEIALGARVFEYYAGAITKFFGQTIPVARGGFDFTLRQPMGAIAAIVPWNFPFPIACWKVAPALAAGNTVVLKPAETTPLTALLFCDVLRQAELPPGVVNIVTGFGDTGAAIMNHPTAAKVAFTGSTEVGKIIMRSLAGTDKKMTMELGGKAANIVFDDAPIDQAVEGIVNGIFFNQGHVCCAGSRLLVQESVADEVIAALQARLLTLRLGDPLDKNTDIGAINSAAQLARIRELTSSGESEGATRWSPPCEIPDRGYWFAPTVFTNVSQANTIAREEIFGPVLSVLTFRTPAEKVEKAKNTPYGLSAGIWTEKGSRIFWMAQRLRAGVIWANTYNRFDPASPFGGYQESGFGREGGRHGLAGYLDA